MAKRSKPTDPATQMPLPFAGELAIADTRRATPLGPQQTWNPDALVGRRGLELYSEMATTDPVIRACLTLRKQALIAPGWKLEPGNDSDAARDLADLLTRDLQELGTPFECVLSELLSCFELGLAVAELVYAVADDEPERIKLRAIKCRAPHDVSFTQDEHGTVTEIVQQGPGGLIKIPPAKVVHLAWNSTFGNPYGTSDLRCVYKTWFKREAFTAWFATHAERLGDPPIFASHPANMGREAVSKLLSVLEKLQARTSLTVPEGTMLHLLETTRDVRSFFTEAIAFFDMIIARALLVPDLAGMSGSQTSGGSYALGSAQQASWFLSLDAMARWLENELQRQLINRMAAWAGASDPRFQDKALWPRFNILPVERDTRTALAQAWLQLVQAGAVTPTTADEEHARQLLGFPSATAGPPLPSRAPRAAMVFAEQPQPHRPLTRAEARADLSTLEALHSRCSTKVRNALADGVTAMVADLQSQLATGSIATMDDVRSMTINPAVRDAVRAGIERELLGARAEGRDHARGEIERARRDVVDRMVTAVEARAVARVRVS